ncbi:MAG TPA: DUF502 domain-containing protein [Stenotrophobium sp.]|jgi:uncharacterized membrane protein|nr:DUF502 domain-containing protein [Stenotrophobium sp.]
MNSLLRRWFVAGLLVWVPLAVTLLVIRFMVSLLDTSLLLIPEAIRPDIPGFGVLLSIVLVLVTGLLAANYLGAQTVKWIEAALGHVPLVRTIYGGMKKLAQTLLSSNSVAFRHALLVRYPHPNSWSIAFQTADTSLEIGKKTGEDLVTVFIPTTPNPTSGFLLLVPRKDVVWLDMPVQEALRLVISLGVVTPDGHPVVQPESAAKAL